MTFISLENVVSCCIKKNGGYTQATMPLKITGVVDGAILDSIINMNLYVLRDVLNLQNVDLKIGDCPFVELFSNFISLGSKTDIKLNWDEESLKTMLMDLSKRIEVEKIKFLDREIKEWIDFIVPIAMKAIDDVDIKDCMEKFKRFGNCDNLSETISKLKNGLEIMDYSIVVNSLISINSVHFPNISIVLYLYLLNSLYLIFMDIKVNESNIPKDDLIINTLCSCFQKMIISNEAYEINCKAICEKNNIKFISEEKLLGFFKRSKDLCNIFPILNTKSKHLYNVETMERSMHKWEAASMQAKISIYRYLKLEEEITIIPYILSYNCSKPDRVKMFLKTCIGQKLSSMDHQIKEIVKPLYQRFDELFNHILFPNESSCLNTVLDNENVMINQNRFDYGEFSIKQFLFDLIFKKDLLKQLIN